MNMYVYNMEIVDFIAYMMPLHDYIELCINNEKNTEEEYPSISSLKLFLMNCFMEVRIRETNWEGDVNLIAISAIPRPTAQVPYRLLVFKQRNNGDSFMVSECEIETYNELEDKPCELITQYSDFDKDDLMRWFYRNMLLIADIFKGR